MTMNRNINVTMTAPTVQQTAQQIATTLNSMGNTTQQAMGRVEARLAAVENRLNRTSVAARTTARTLNRMNENGEKTQKSLQRLSSASAGVMLGLSALQGSVTGLGFGLIFLQFSTLKYAAAAAALTIAIGGAAGLAWAFTKLTKAAWGAGAALESTGQQLTNFFRDAREAQAIMSQGDQFARRFGLDRTQVRSAIADLHKVGIQGEQTILAIANASAATGKAIPEVTKDYLNAVRSGGDSMREFAKHYSLPGTAYADSLQLAMAMNERFEGSAARSAETVTGMWSRIGNTGKAIVESMGTIWVGFIQPLQKAVLAFLDGILQGFLEVRNAARDSGELARSVEDLRAAVRRVIPILSDLGRFIGRGLAAATIWAARGIKTLVDVTRTTLKWFKAMKDQVVSLAQEWKEGRDHVDAFRLRLALIGPAVSAALRTLGRMGAVNLGKLFALSDESIAKDATGLAQRMRDVLRRVLGGIFRGIFRPDLLIKDIFGGLGRVGKNVFIGLLKGLRQGLLFALFELLALTAVDLLPIQDSLKKSLANVIKLGFLLAIPLAMFGVPAVLATTIGLAIIGGLELAFPGTAEKIHTWLNGVFASGLSGLQTVGAGILQWSQEVALPAFRTFADGVQGFVVGQVLPTLDRLRDWFVEKGKQIGEGAQRLWREYIQPAFGAIAGFVTGVLLPALGRLADWVMTYVWPRIRQFADWLSNVFMRVLEIIVIFLQDQWQRSWQAAKDIFEDIQPVFDAVWWILQKLWDIVKLLAEQVGGPLLTALGDLYEIAEFFLKPIIDWLVTKGLNVLKDIADDIPTPLELIAAAVDWLTQVLKNMVQPIKDAIGFLGTLVSLMDRASGLLGGVWGGIKDATKKGLETVTGGVNVKGKSRALGGRVPGRPGERQLIMAEAGEYFGGHPILEGARASVGRMGGGGSMQVTIDLRGAVISDDRALEKLADQISEKIFGRQTTGRRMSLHIP